MAQLVEYFKMAMKNIWANKARTLLTMLGIIIGISSVILIISIGNGATDMITTELGSLGKGQIAFAANEYDDKYAITDEQFDDIKKIEGVKTVGIQQVFDGTTKTKRDKKIYTVTLVELNADGFGMLDSKLVRGRQFNEKEEQAGKMVCVIRESDAMKLFGSTDVVGLDIPVGYSLGDNELELTYTVIGVLESEEENKITSAFMDPSVQLITPLNCLAKTLGLNEAEGVWDFYVLADEKVDAKQICDDVIDYLETSHHCKGKKIYYFQSFDDIMGTVNNVISLITVFVAFVASISLLVGGIGVMNIMLVSVTERTREIGIRKALGAKTGSITVQFLAESAFITLIGGLLGILLGVGGALIVSKVIGSMVPAMQFSPSLNLSTILLTSLFSSGVGLFFGIYPARKAAKLSPIEALRRN